MGALRKIPIQNIYYLLCYSWNKLDEKDIVDVAGIDSTNLFDLFAKVLIGGIHHLLKRGLDRGYISYSEDTSCIRGKINFADSLKKNLYLHAKLQCEYDDLSYDILHNQILKATCNNLLKVDSLDQSLKDGLLGIIRKLDIVQDIKISSTLFSQIQLNTNNFFYGFLLNICEIIHEDLLVSEEQGDYKLRDFLEQRMHTLFESFVRNFYRQELCDAKVYRENIYWDIVEINESTKDYIPQMETDISIEQNGQKTIVEAKYYSKTFATRNEKKRFHSNHLYQLFSYLKNIESKKGNNKNCNGILLYPEIDHPLDEQVIISGHYFSMKTINLNQDWRIIHENMMNIVN